MKTASRLLDRTFPSLRIRNYRLFFVGQIISVTGTWTQTVAQAWLVLKLTHSGVALGTVVALQFLPVLLLGAYGGLIADRVSKRKLLLVTQVIFGLLATILGVLTATGLATIPLVYLLALLLGCVNAIDNPTRQAFVVDMVGAKMVSNAVSLNSVVMNATRMVGPGVAAALIAGAGIAPCFFANAISYLAAIAALLMMRTSELNLREKISTARGQVREGIAYAWSNPTLRTLLLMMLFIGAMTFEFQVSLALLSSSTFHDGAAGYGLLLSVQGAGSVAGGLLVASLRRTVSTRAIAVLAALFGLFMLGAAASPGIAMAAIFLIPTGAAGIAFSALVSTNLLLRSSRQMRGRVMALYSIALMGSTPVGAPLVGWIAQLLGARWGVASGGITALGVGLVVILFVQREAHTPAIAAMEPSGASPAAEAN